MTTIESGTRNTKKKLRYDAPEAMRAYVLAQVERRLADSSHFRGHVHCVTTDYGDGVLTLRGCVPSFYLKQVVQSLLCDLDGVDWVDNQIDVVNSTGLSSVRAR